MLTILSILTGPAGVGVLSAVAAMLPPPSMTAGPVYRGAYTVVNALGMNFGHATNRSAPQPWS